MNCKNCGGANSPDASFCKFCDSALEQPSIIYPHPRDGIGSPKKIVTTTTTTYYEGDEYHHSFVQPQSAPPQAVVSTKNKTVVFCLCLFLGVFGVHYFYVRRYGMGIFYLFTRGLFGIGVLYDLYRIFSNKFPDADGKPLSTSV